MDDTAGRLRTMTLLSGHTNSCWDNPTTGGLTTCDLNLSLDEAGFAGGRCRRIVPWLSAGFLAQAGTIAPGLGSFMQALVRY
jgi:hypothetical protein